MAQNTLICHSCPCFCRDKLPVLDTGNPVFSASVSLKLLYSLIPAFAGMTAFLILLICSPLYAEEIKFLKVEKFVDNVDFPIALCYYDKDIILFTEKSGAIKVVKNGKLYAEPLKKFNVTTGFERGLLGIACKDKKVYVYFSYRSGLKTYNRVVSFPPERIILDRIPGAVIHNGGMLTVGPDGKLYISTGDARDEESAQDLNSLSGKVLRINLDGTIPDDNPYKGSTK